MPQHDAGILGVMYIALVEFVCIQFAQCVTRWILPTLSFKGSAHQCILLKYASLHHLLALLQTFLRSPPPPRVSPVST
jgi:hypothetical protein